MKLIYDTQKPGLLSCYDNSPQTDSILKGFVTPAEQLRISKTGASENSQIKKTTRFQWYS